MRTYRIHFIRHGLTEANADGRYIGVTDLPLSDSGADELDRIRVKGELPETGLLFTSPLKRCIETCEILFPDTEPTVVEQLREFDFGEFENKTAMELSADPRYTEWTAGRVAPPDGEDSAAFTNRIVLGLNIMVRQMMEQEVFEATAVMHGGVMMTLFALCALPRRRAVEWTSDAGQGYTALITPSLYGKSGVIEIIDTVPSTAMPAEDDF